MLIRGRRSGYRQLRHATLPSMALPRNAYAATGLEWLQVFHNPKTAISGTDMPLVTSIQSTDQNKPEDIGHGHMKGEKKRCRNGERNPLVVEGLVFLIGLLAVLIYYRYFS